MNRDPQPDASSSAARQRSERAHMIEMLRQKMLRDDSVCGGTLILPDGHPVYLAREDLLRWPARADA